MRKLFFAVLSVFIFSTCAYSDSANIFSVDKTVPGTTTSGIQEAINSANSAGGGIVQLDCSTVYTMNPVDGGWIFIGNMENIIIRGCGKSSSIIEAVGDFSDLDFTAIFIYGGSKFITLEDFGINIDNTCSAGDCNIGNDTDEAIFILGKVNHIDIRRLNIKILVNEEIMPITDKADVRGIHIACDQTIPDVPECWDIGIDSNRLEVSDRNLEILSGSNIDVMNNHFENPSESGKAAASFQLLKYVGFGVRVIGNHFDMNTQDEYLGLHNHIGINIRNSLFTGKPATSTQIIGNTFYNLKNHIGEIGIRIIGYDMAIISNNYFKCADPLNCDALGVKFENNSSCEKCNKGNVITGNIFDGWRDTATIGAPIYFGSSEDDNEGNIISNNVFDTGDQSVDGFGGDLSFLVDNYILNNIVRD